ncbi:MAG: TIGR03086 family metal-binding protein [Sciscionella sp.]
MYDLHPATRTLVDLVTAVRDDQLGAPTPCADMALRDLLDHVDGLCLAFSAAARKRPLPDSEQAPSADGSRLGARWRTRIPQRCSELAESWRDPAAWTGMTSAGGIELPGEVAGLVALDEVIVHGWDIAVASGQHFNSDAALLEAAFEFVRAAARDNPQGTPGLFGPPVPVAEAASPVDRLIGMTGRDPGWRPSPAHA